MNSAVTNFFASIYEWFGFNPYGKDLGDHLRGWDPECSGQYMGSPWYTYIGASMMIITLLVYAIQYHIIDSPRFLGKQHWWLMALILVIVNFIVAFTIPFNSLQTGNYCLSGENAINFSGADCFMFGISNALWSLLLFATITSVPWLRRFSTNCPNTTFWKP